MTTSEGRPEGETSGLILPRFISLVLVLTPLAGMVLVLCTLLWVGIRPTYKSLVPDQNGRLPAYFQELDSANNEHRAIVQTIAACLAKAGRDVVDDPFVRIDPGQSHEVNLAAIQRVTQLPGYLDAALYLSYEMAFGRGQLAGQVVTEHLIMQVFEWTIVATGLFTTILISVKAFASPRSRDYMLMAVAAIVLSAFGTAVSTLNSFYTPRIEFERSERSLANLRTLHWNLAASVTRQNDPCRDKKGRTDWRMRKIRDLTNGFVAIMGAPERSPSADEDDPTDTDQSPPAPKSRTDAAALERLR